ncbi:pentapeptide repeat-containing protein [Phormidesmis priestleyi]|uniref:pentapeptide repeat-containing protein n=1 Tax=Phormidesmis priestleyi TaxID=268141 RepID=UPI001FD33FE8|nr:pentapeptide repeat-containing protein [Phormidesmis priestleyi]
MLSAYIAWRALRGDEKFALIRTIGVAFGAIGGTSFCGADLTDADFTKAIIKSTNFNHTRQKQTILHQVCWSNATKLDRARLGTSILANPAVCELLTIRNGYKKSYKNVDLYNANLKGINLECANLEQANLSHAALQQANLNHANLTKTLAVGADFSQAYLTGACLESWNIDHTTKLDRVDCQFVYLLEQPNAIGSRERRPHDPDKVFQPGDFEKLYKKIMDTVQILLRDGMNREAFAAAFQELMQKNPDITHESILAIERKGSDALLTLEVAPDADKAKISQDFLKPYEDQVRQLQAKIDHLQQLRSADIKDIALELARHPLNVTNQAVGTGTMQETNDSSRNINIGNIGGNFNASGQALNLGDISGNVTNTINQLPESTTEQPGIKELLTELQTAIASDSELSGKGKTNALEQVKTLAEVGQNPEQPEKKSLGEKAMIFLKGTIANLPDTAKLAEASSKLLPLIAKALGLPV